MKRKPYPSDVTDEQWALLAPLIPPARPGGRPRKTDVREVVNALFYLNREGCSWRALPHDFPPWRTVYNYFQGWQWDGTWQKLLDACQGTPILTQLGDTNCYAGNRLLQTAWSPELASCPPSWGGHLPTTALSPATAGRPRLSPALPAAVT
jgi:putative transposase